MYPKQGGAKGRAPISTGMPGYSVPSCFVIKLPSLPQGITEHFKRSSLPIAKSILNSSNISRMLEKYLKVRLFEDDRRHYTLSVDLFIIGLLPL